MPINSAAKRLSVPGVMSAIGRALPFPTGLTVTAVDRKIVAWDYAGFTSVIVTVVESEALRLGGSNPFGVAGIGTLGGI